MTHYHLAQINVGRMIAPVDSPQMASFVALLDPVNRAAEQAPGYVWRLQTPDGNATGVQAFDDPSILVNYSVWESIESLKEFTYKTVHTQPLRRRGEWFEKSTEPHMALWWIPAGYVPSVAEARQRWNFDDDMEIRLPHFLSPNRSTLLMCLPLQRLTPPFPITIAALRFRSIHRMATAIVKPSFITASVGRASGRPTTVVRSNSVD